MKALGIAALIGLSIVLLVWGLRGYLTRRFQRDADWIARNRQRFNPEPVDAKRWTIYYYVAFILLLLVLVFITPNPLFGVVFWLILLAVPKIIVESMWQKRRRQIDLQLPPAISSLANSLRAGLTLVQAIQRLSENAPEPIRTEFRIMANRYSFGAGIEVTIDEARDRLKSQNFNLFASALLVNREMGGDAAETLSRISRSLDKLHHMRQTVEAHTAEGRTNIKVLLVAPVILLLMMSTADAEGVKMLFTTSQGYAVLMVAGVFIAAGIFFAGKITHAEI
ncbi:type II secretion system F family protein [Humisphaera borealis]|uniref:Type II secretion system F family protein n=1 Tax=Humisphaera borealis TaxID=2807512 RepID=A0A7M2WT58_9BACT|nr:type II secretion system F family protein [Humisphaera borealis]QOV88001.1 type II secretion system F family protein [Humisphaera borealis]